MDDNKETSKQFNQSSTNPPKPPAPNYKPVARPVSKQQIDELHRKLSKPTAAVDHTPMGSHAHDAKKQRDDETLRSIEAVRRRLESCRGAAREAFERGVDGKTIKRGM